MTNLEKTKIWVFLSCVSLGLLIAGFWFFERQGLLVGLLLALSINGLVFHFSERHWVDHFHAKLLDGTDPWGILEMVQDLSGRAKVVTPRVYIVPLGFPTAFSVGRNSSRSRILLSDGALRTLNPVELRAIIAHEIARIKRGEPFFFGLVSGFMSPLTVIADILDLVLKVLSFGKKKTHFFRNLTVPVLGFFSTLFLSKKTSFEIDQSAAQLLRDPETLAKVLLKLNTYSLTRDFDIPPSAAEFLIVNPLTSKGAPRYFHSQPAVPQRIKNLIGRYPV